MIKDETLEEQFEIVKRMKKRNSNWKFAICPICKTWAVLLNGYKGMHPLCFEKQNGKLPKKNLNTDQGKLL